MPIAKCRRQKMDNLCKILVYELGKKKKIQNWAKREEEAQVRFITAGWVWIQICFDTYQPRRRPQNFRLSKNNKSESE